MSNSSKQIKYGAVLSYVAIGINVITGLLFTPWMIHSIGKEDFGLYTLAMSVIAIFVFDFGLSSAVTRFLSRYIAEEDQTKANNFLGLVLRLYLLIDVFLFFVLLTVFFFVPSIYKELTPDEISKFKVVYCVAALYSVVSFPAIPINGVLTAHERFIQLKCCDVCQKVLIVVSMAICLLQGYGLYALVLVNAVSGLFIIIIKVILVFRKTSQGVNIHYFDFDDFKEVVGYSVWVTVIALAQRCIFNLAPSILGALSGSVSIAILGIAITIEGYTFTIANALNGMFLPRVTRILYSGDGDVLPLMIRVGRIQLYIISLIVLGFICFGREFITLWVGQDFNESFLCAVLIILPSLFHLPQEIGNQAIYAMNEIKSLAIVYLCMAIVNVIIGILLSPYFGALGISISICISYLLRTVGMDWIFYKRMRINVFLFFKETYLKLALPLLCLLIMGFLIHLIPSSNWLVLGAKILIFVILFFASMCLFSMNRTEKELLLSPFVALINRMKR